MDTPGLPDTKITTRRGIDAPRTETRVWRRGVGGRGLYGRPPHQPPALVELVEPPLEHTQVVQRLPLAPAVHPGRHLDDAFPPRGVEVPPPRRAVRALNRDEAGVVAGEHETAVIFERRRSLPHDPQGAVVLDARRDVQLGILDRVEVRGVRPDRGQRVGHELHDAAPPIAAPRRRIEAALGQPLRLEVPPVERRAEKPLAVLAERMVVAVRIPSPLPFHTRGTGERQQDGGCRRAPQLSALPMMIAMATNSDPMKMATAMLPRFSSAGKSTPRVSTSKPRYEAYMRTTPRAA